MEENAKVKKSDISELIASAAEKYIGSRGWGYKSKKGSFGSGTFKNHLFVAKVIAAAGEASSSPDVVSQFLKDPLLAREWGSNVEIPNWEIVDRPQRGDVVAIGYKNKSMDETGRRYSGEVGIVVNVGIVGTEILENLSLYLQYLIVLSVFYLHLELVKRLSLEDMLVLHVI